MSHIATFSLSINKHCDWHKSFSASIDVKSFIFSGFSGVLVAAQALEGRETRA